MTLPTDAEVRKLIAEVRKLVAYPTTGPKICRLEELIVDLVARERRAPTHLTAPDGFPPGGGSEIRGNSEHTTTEAAALALLDPEHNDQVGPKVLTMLDMLQQAAMSARATRNLAEEANHLSTLSKRPVGQTAEDCQQEDCTYLATRKGNCNACRVWLDRHPDVRVVPREVIANRNKPRYESGPYADAS